MPLTEPLFTGVPSLPPSTIQSQLFSDLTSNIFLDPDTDDALMNDLQLKTDGDADLFKYFLNEDLQPDSSPLSSDNSIGSAQESPDSSPHTNSLPNFLKNASPFFDSPDSPLEPFSSPLDVGANLTNDFDGVIPNTPANNLQPIRIKEENTHIQASLPMPNKENPVTPSTQNAPLPATSKENPRKRAAPVTTTSTSNPPKGLSRDELLKLSSKGLETYAASLSSQRTLSAEEERQLKRQRRLIKNRESAQLSRLRKKVYIEELERKVSILTNENEHLTKQVSTITADKEKLQEEVAYLQNIIKQSPALSQIAANHTNTIGNKKGTKNVKAAGVCLLIVLFSFGLLFNANPNINFKLQEGENSKHLYTGRLLKSISEENGSVESSTESIAQLLPQLPSIDQESHFVTENQITKPRKHPRDVNVIDNRDSNDLNKKRKMKISDEDSPRYVNDVLHKSVDLVPISKSEGSVVVTESAGVSKNHLPSSDAELVIQSSGIAKTAPRPNTSYIYCSEAQRVTPVAASVNPQAPENIALLIPSSVLNATQDPQFDRSLLEVTCQVLNLHVWPMQNISQRP